MSSEVRDIYIKRLKQDLMGPYQGRPDEVIDFSPEGPDKEYFIGKIYPKNSEISEDVLEEIIEESKGKGSEDTKADETINRFDRPSSFGLTLAIRRSSNPKLNIYSDFGKYFHEKTQDESGKDLILWRRKSYSNFDSPVIFEVPTQNSNGDIQDAFIEELNLQFSYKTRILQDDLISVSIFAVNESIGNPTLSFIEKTEQIIFQSGFTSNR